MRQGIVDGEQSVASESPESVLLSQSEFSILAYRRELAKVKLQRSNRLSSARFDADLTEKRNPAIGHTFHAGMLG